MSLHKIIGTTRENWLRCFGDCRGYALLSRFFGYKVLTTISVQRSKLIGKPPDNAVISIAFANDALKAWDAYTQHMTHFYVPQRLTRTDVRFVSLGALSEQAHLDVQMIEHLMQEYKHIPHVKNEHI